MIYFVTWKVFKELLAMAVQCSLEQAPKVNYCKCKSSWLLCRRSSYVYAHVINIRMLLLLNGS